MKTPGKRLGACAILVLLTIGVPHAMVYVVPFDWDSAGERVRKFRPEVPFQNDFAHKCNADGRIALDHMQGEPLVIATWGPYSTLRYLQEVDGLCPGAKLLCLYGDLDQYRRLLAVEGEGRNLYLYIRNGQSRLLAWAENELGAAEVAGGELHKLYLATRDALPPTPQPTRQDP